MRRLKLFILILLTSFCGAGSTLAQSNSLYLEDFTANQTLLYDFGSFASASNPAASSFSAAGVSTNIPASGDSFGGLGVAPTVPSVNLTGTTTIEVIARANAGNESDLVISIREQPTSDGTIGEFFSYVIPASRFPVGGGFVTVTVDPASGFNGDSTNGVLDGPLHDTGIQSPFGGSSAHHYTVQSVNFIDGLPEQEDVQACVDPVSIHGALSVSGSQIIDQNGEAVSFAGNSMFWSNTGFGAEQYYNENVIDWLQQDWNSTIVRAAMGVDEFGGYLSDPQGNQARITAVVDAAIANGMYVIIDWHSHHAEDYQEQAIEFFKEMAQQYGDTPNVIYEIYNEPLSVSWSDTIKPYAEAVIAEIRAIDPDNLIVVGTPFFSQEVDVASQDPITGSNIAYTLHFYAATHGDALRQRAQTAIDNGIALMVTEWGTVEASGDGAVDEFSTQQWLAFMDQHNISHLNWAVNDKLEGASILRPNASAGGGWSDFDLTPSGLLVRDIIRDWNTCVEVPGVLLGDCNLDGEVNFLDISPFIVLLSGGTFLEQADCNQDGEVNFMDISAFINILSVN